MSIYVVCCLLISLLLSIDRCDVVHVHGSFCHHVDDSDRLDLLKRHSKRVWWIIFFHYNARSALYHGIRALGIGSWDEIILQAYTCVSVPNAIIATGAKPIYCDIDPDTLNIDPHKIIQLITPKTKAILIQHTFWISADIQSIQTICTDHHLMLIEDVCHALWWTYQWQKLGTFWDIAIFSFGRDKIISSVNEHY